MTRPQLTRRELVASAGAVGALTAGVPPAWARGLLSHRARVGPGRFADGVASGEPSHSAVTFWSRLRTSRPRTGARLVVAKDAGMRKVVATTVVPTGVGLDGALKARVGGLAPGAEYFYAWESGTDVSPIGRTRTTPAPDASQPLRVAFSSCQQYSAGFFGAHAHAALQEDLDLYLFLGDYVYELGSRRARAREIRADGITAVDLASYRRKYELYRSDPGLRDLHRLHPIAHVWDDHEVANNYTEGDVPAPAAQRRAAYRAAFEWLPRMTFPTERHRLYKRIPLGRVADVFLLDGRQYRTRDAGRPRQLLGEAQMAWLLDGLRTSTATWKLIGQQLVMGAAIGGEDNVDGWDGHAEDRTRLLREIERARIPNVVVLSGDAHVFMANLLAGDFDALGEGRAAPSAVEYVGGSVTSPGRELDEMAVQDTAPWNRQYDGYRHGYAYLGLAPDVLVTEYRAIDRFNPAGDATAFERFVQPSGANQFTRQRA